MNNSQVKTRIYENSNQNFKFQYFNNSLMSKSEENRKIEPSSILRHRLSKFSGMPESKSTPSLVNPLRSSLLNSRSSLQLNSPGRDEMDEILVKDDDSLLYRPMVSTTPKYRLGFPLEMTNLASKTDLMHISERSELANMSNGHGENGTNDGPDAYLIREFEDDIEERTTGRLSQRTGNFELNHLLKLVEEKFARIEKRIENNEGLIKLHDEMQKLHQTEKEHALEKEQVVLQEVHHRLNDVERKMDIIGQDLKSQNVGVQLRLEDFTKKVDQYLKRFAITSAELGKKFDALASEKGKENNVLRERLALAEEKLNKLTFEIQERFKTLYDIIEEEGRKVEETSNNLENERYNVRRLEDDFLQLLNTSKNINKSQSDMKWMSEELLQLKFRQIDILHHLKLVNPSNNHSNNTSMY